MGKVALVTGGSRGIGLATARALAKSGMRVAITHLGTEPPPDLYAVRCDVRDAGAVDEAFTAVERDLGAVEVLVANAGITRDRLLATMTENDFEDVLRTNLSGAYHVARRAIRSMIRRRAGRIIAVSSASAIIGARGQANYVAAKAGMIGFARATALELASRNITVNVVAPGWIETAMTRDLPDATREAAAESIPMGRFGTDEEVAEVIAFLAGPGASYLTGVVLPVDGGLTLER
ncbi:3-oxoacyl-ACP reductase FabG [Amycolatopsis albispora]|uniref:Beta-ketoacyl-ACP reductase n=1 Tax=Amycolatopsis albispora TaxID=1804986 RepID=A0A344L5G8_9PSEU|nr:3-oxoacyl-ACP reductase FabG [Amycolatopsis albispora]AXB43292.1 beta-ketoacyl-ACP reductase [Amycolatopsis albispora]